MAGGVGCGYKEKGQHLSVFSVRRDCPLFHWPNFFGLSGQRFSDHVWIFIVSLLVVITGTIWGFVDWMSTRTHKRKSQTDPAYANQTEPPPARGIIAFWVGFIFILLCAIAFVIFGLLLLYAIGGHG